MADFICATIISMAAFLLVVVVVLVMALGAMGSRGRGSRTYGTVQLGYGQSLSKSFQPTRLYHGTTLANALEIFNTDLFLVGNSRPYAFWMGDRIEIAKRYARNNGGIVEINADPGVQLTNRSGGVWIYQIPDALPNKEYYRIPGLRPVGVLSPDGSRIR